MNKATGWIQDPLDGRDFLFGASNVGVMALPKHASLIPYLFSEDPNDQKSVANCVTEAWERSYAIRKRAMGEPYQKVSTLFPYFNARAARGDRLRDRGCMPRLAFKSIQRIGSPLEEYWPFSTSSLRVLRQPNWKAYSNAYQNRDFEYQRIAGDRAYAVKTAIVSKRAVCVGLDIEKSFKKYSTGIIKPPTEPISGHMVCIEIGRASCRERVSNRV